MQGQKFLFIFLFLIPFYGFTQQWSCARPGGEYVFYSPFGYVSFATDSFYSTGQDTFLITRNKFSGNDPTRLCYDHHEHYSWIGRQIILKQDGSNLFVRRKDTLVIQTQAKSGQTWTCVKTDSILTEAMVTETGTFNWQGSFIDSFKLVRFRIKNIQNQLLYDTNTCISIYLSKNHGLFSAVAWNDTTRLLLLDSLFNDVRQTGSNSPVWGFRNKTTMEMVDYQVGDEFHHEYFNGANNNPHLGAVRIHTIYKVLSKQVLHSDSVVYQVFRYFTRTNRYPDSSTVLTGQDTIQLNNFKKTLPFYLNAGCGDNYFPGQSEILKAVYWGIFANNRIQKSPDEYLSYMKTDSCYETLHLDGPCIRTTFMVEGILGTFTECMGVQYSDYNKLLYYKKGNEVWGAPLFFNEPILSTIEWNVYPNPTSENELVVRCNSSARMLLEMFDTIGKQVYSDSLRSTKSINISYLPAGIYLIRLTDEYGNSGVKKLIRN